MKMMPFNVMSGGTDMVSYCLQYSFLVRALKCSVFLHVPVMESLLSFANIKIIAVPATSFELLVF